MLPSSTVKAVTSSGRLDTPSVSRVTERSVTIMPLKARYEVGHTLGYCEIMDWIDELDLSTDSPWPAMGTRSLGRRPWLVFDELAETELAVRRTLLDTRPDDVLAEPDTAGAAVAELFELVKETVPAVAEGRSPLDRLGRSIQEDLCLLDRGETEWVLRAAVLCFPSRWRLIDKLDRPLTEVHGPTPRYPERLAARVTSLLDRLGDRVVLRRNWFVHPDPTLFQPERPPAGDPVIPAARCADELYVRSERQTLRRLPRSGWTVFTIRIQQQPLGGLLARRGAAFGAFLDHADPDLIVHRGISPAQRRQLLRI